MIKKRCPTLKITALFDPNIDNDDDSAGDVTFKTNGLVELLEDYNRTYGQKFDLGNHGKFKTDIAARLAHKDHYKHIANEPAKQLDLLIVVEQMLTGYDSKWVNTLYLDKVLQYENIIQAFSRANRLFGPDKPFGTIRYYRKPHTMKRNVDAAVKLYSGDKPIGLFADRLASNIERMNASFAEITAIFDGAGIDDFKKLPDDLSERATFAKYFQEFNSILEAARIQGFTWERTEYKYEDNPKHTVKIDISHQQYLTLLQRYKELGRSGGGGEDSIPFDIDSHISEIDTGKIDADYMNSRFKKYLKVLQDDDHEVREATLSELQRSFSSLSQDEQKIAEIFLRDMQRGDVEIDPTRSFRDYLTDYQAQAKNAEIDTIVKYLGIDADKLIALMNTRTTEANLNEYGRFDELKATIDKQKAKAYFEALEGQTIPPFKVNIKVADLMRNFIIQGGFELELSVDK